MKKQTKQDQINDLEEYIKDLKDEHQTEVDKLNGEIVSHEKSIEAREEEIHELTYPFKGMNDNTKYQLFMEMFDRFTLEEFEDFIKLKAA